MPIARDPYNIIIPRLMVGRQPNEYPLPPNLGLLVLCAEEYQPPDKEFPNVRILRCPLADDLNPLSKKEIALVTRVTRKIAEAVKLGKKVLITCHAGINRSAFVAAMAIRRITGLGGQHTINLLREMRPLKDPNGVYYVLCNSIFEEYVKCSGKPAIARL